MTRRIIALLVVFMLAWSGSILAAAEGDAEAKAKADYEASVKAANDAEAAVAPVKAAMQKADTAYAEARKAADAKRQQATDAKNLAGDAGVKELQQAEEAVPAANKALEEASGAKPPLDQALTEAKATAAPLQQTYDDAAKAAKEAEVNAKLASDAANKIDDEAKRATAQAAARRRAADAAKAALARAEQNEQNLQNQARALLKKLPDAQAQSKAADDAFAGPKSQLEAALAAFQTADQTASAAEANAKVVSEGEKQKAATEAQAARKIADDAKAALTQVQQNQEKTRAWADSLAKKLADAPGQKKAAEEALASAKKHIADATSACPAAEQAAQAADAAAKAVAANADKSADDKKQAADDAAAKAKAAAAAKTALTQAQHEQDQAQAQIDAAAKRMWEIPAKKKSAGESLANVTKRVGVASAAFQTADSAAQSAEATAKALAERAGRSKEQLQQAQADAATKRKAADAAKTALAQVQSAAQNPQNAAASAAQKLARLTAQKNLTDAALASAKTQIASATTVAQAAEQAAQDAAKLAEEKNQVVAQATAKRKAIADAAAALAQAQQGEQQVQAQDAAAVQKAAELQTQKKSADDALAKVEEQVAAAKAALAKALEGEKVAQNQASAVSQKLTDAEKQKSAADAALAGARTQVAAATTANQAAQDAAKELAQLDAARKQAVDDAAAKAKAAAAAKVALTPVQQNLDKAAIAANSAAQKLALAEARKKSADEALEGLKKRIASSKETYAADEEAAKAAEAVAVPLKTEADNTRTAYAAAIKVADDNRGLAEQAKARFYRLVEAREAPALMESTEAPKPANRIDEIVFAKLKQLDIQPVLCSDAVFVRRAYLDLTGTLPSAEDAKTFIQSSDQNKRVALIDHLLDQPTHVHYWAMKWSDILRVKAEFPVKVWPNAAQAYHRWVWESIAQNKPYDKFARELLTSSGSNFRVGPVNFYRAIQDKTPEGISAVVGLSLMGTRVQFWPDDRKAGMAVFFSQVGYKPTSEWKEEIVFWDPLNSIAVPGSIAPGIDNIAKSVTATNQIPQALDKPMGENGPLPAMFPDGTKTTIPPDRDPREVFADWLIRPENPWFAKAIVNRTWAWVMGRGIIHEPDNIRDDNPPSNPELLAYLEKEFVSSGYDMKRLKRLIFTSTTYQFSSIPRFKAPEAKANFASYLMRRVEAEVLTDALSNITGSSDLYTSAVPEPFTYIPSDMSAVALADGSITSSFLTLFGRSARATGVEGERVNELASPQWLHMLNSATLQNKLQNGPKLGAIISSGAKPNEIIEKLYLTILSRFPTEADVKSAEEYAKSRGNGREAWIDLTWALINSPEFLMRH